MKFVDSAIYVIVSCVFIFSQSLPVNKSKEAKEIKTKSIPVEVKTDTIPRQENYNTPLDETEKTATTVNDNNSNVKTPSDTGRSTEDASFVNPFISGGEGDLTTPLEAESKEEITEPTGSPQLSESQEEEEPLDEEEGGIDFLVDLAVGISMPRFTVKPEYISTEGKPNILFSSGIVIPFAKYFHAGIAVKYMQLSCNKSVTDVTDATYPIISSELKTKETLSFVSAPVKVGMQIELGMFTPYLYADIEPAYLVAGGQFINEKIKTVFDAKGNQLVEEYEQNINTSDLRERHQIFVGGGIGCLIYYGYGYIYVDAASQYAIKETGTSEDLKKGRPAQTSGRVIFFPVSIGLRFFL